MSAKISYREEIDCKKGAFAVKLIGHVEYVQIQKEPLKSWVGSERIYDPSPIVRVQQLLIDNDGIVGVDESGQSLIDVHNRRHPRSRNSNGINALSIGFTSHYAAMRKRFGSGITDGCAGENIIVAVSEIVKPSELGSRLVLYNVASDRRFELEAVQIAAPCAEFSRFAAGYELDSFELKAVLQFLDNGMRGYYARVSASVSGCTVEAGDLLYRL